MVQGKMQMEHEAEVFDLPVDPALLAALSDDMAPLRPAGTPMTVPPGAPGALAQAQGLVGTRVEVLFELAGIKAAMASWWKKDPDQVLRECSAYGARLTQLWTDLRLVEQYDRNYMQIRTMQVTPVIEEIQRQYEYVRSRVALARQEIDMLK